MSRTAEIKVTVDLDPDSLPNKIVWEASDAPGAGPQRCHSLMLSFWDSDNKTTAAIDLWVKDTTIEDMNLYFYQVFHKMADTYLRATRNDEVSNLIHELGDKFAETLGLLGSER